ncbi:hypothetical protein AB0H83_50165 [Dactylosporangium sp. NPDC050688]|uniref:hypothetical protein n=1 Tax=Dactylosporangium sp. NPDC050688 TaxID=3157217 RepID=UPI0033EF0C25
MTLTSASDLTSFVHGEPDAVRDRLLWGMRDVPFPPKPISLHPVLLPAGVYTELHTAAGAVLDALVRVARRLGRDRDERLAALGIDPATTPLFVADEAWEWRYAASIARPDAFVTPDGIKFIEYNAGGGVGAAVQTQLLADAWVDDIYAGRGLFAYRPFEARADMFEAMAAREGTARAVVLMGSVADLVRGVSSTRYFDAEVDHLRRRGMDAAFFEPSDLLDGIFEPGGRLRYPIGLRHFTVQEWSELGVDWSPVGTAIEAGCQLVSSETSSLLYNKKLLGVASEGQPGMNDADRELLERYLPWTRIVGDREVTYDGSRHALPELLHARQERFLLKGATGMKGEQVLMGRDATTAEWAAAITEAVTSGEWVVQERVESLRFPMTVRYDTGAVATDQVAPVLGPFVIGGQPAGCLARYFPDGADGVVSVERHGAAQNIAVAANR